MDANTEAQAAQHTRPDDRAVVLLGHGSVREEANQEVRAMWARLALQLPDLHISGAFVEVAEPTLEQEIDRLVAAGVARVVIVPMFLTSGQHLRTGIPNMLRRIRERYPALEIEMTGHLGADPLLAEIVKNRLHEAGL